MVTESQGQQAALAEWQRLLGPEHVITDPAALRAAETVTFATAQSVPAILRPGSRDEVRELLRIAARFRTPVYVVSSGKNWGYGSRAPVRGSCALIELSRMNRILDFSEELAYVTVEPGVTQQQLYDFLRERKSKLWLDVTGASPACSLIGNTVERGFGHTPYCDHFAHSCGLEIVLPNGEIVETGFARFPGAKAAPVYRSGVGPSIDGLFTQSNLGVVTRMTVWLMPAPEYFQAVYIRCDGDRVLGPLVDALRPLRLNGTLRSAMHIANDYKVISAVQQYPWKETGGETPLGEVVMARLRKNLNFGNWNVSGALYGTRAQVREARRLLRRSLAGKISKIQFLDDRLLALAETFSGPFGWLTGWDLRRMLELVRPVYGLMKGIPTDHPLGSTYWRKRAPIPASMDPDRDGCGLLWCSPVCPLEGSLAEGLTRMASDLILERGFEPMLSLTMVDDRALACVISISYDRELSGEDERAMACYRALLDQLHQQGYYSYRLGIQSMAAMNGPAGYNQLLRTIKQAVDPQEIFAPGRYQPE